MAYELTDLLLEEVSGVDVPANQHAGVVLAKRFVYTDGVKPKNEGAMMKGDGSVTVEELTKKLESFQSQVADLTKRAETAEAALEALTKSAEAAGLDVVDGEITKRADPEYVEIDGEKVEKSLVPAPVLKALEKAAADIAKMQQKAEEAELAKRGASELPNLAGTDLAKGRLLKALEGDADLLAAVKAADAAMKANYTETGSGEVDSDALDADARLTKMARDYAAEKGVTFEQAYDTVTQSGEGAEILARKRLGSN